VSVSTDAAHKTVQELTDVMFEIIPEHAIYMSDNPQIDVEFPDEIQISSAQCEIKDVSLTGSTEPITPICTRFQQSFTIKQFLPQDYIPSEGNSIKFTVGKVRNAEAVRAVTGLTVTLNAEESYAIDEFEGDIDWMPIKGDFVDAQISPSSLVSYQESVTYTIRFIP
jgi:hypothetical protein